MRRLEIEEVGVEETDIRQAARSRVEESHSKQRKETESKDNQMFAKFTNPGMINPPAPTPQTDQEPKPVINKTESETKLDLSSVQKEAQASVSPRSEVKSLSPRSFSVPASSFQFQADYKVLKTDMSVFYDYLKVKSFEIFSASYFHLVYPMVCKLLYQGQALIFLNALLLNTLCLYCRK